MRPEEAELAAFKDCFERNGTPRRLDAIRWQYLENPTRELIVGLAVADDRVVSIYAVQPAFVRVQGARRLAVQSVDTLVDADFRGRGLFTKMAEAVYERVSAREGAFVYGFPNANSAPGFFGKLGWSSLDPVPFLVRPLRTAFLASRFPVLRLLPRVPDLRLPVGRPRLRENEEIRPVTEFGSELDALWERFASDIEVAVERDSRYLRWRLGKPGERYECVGLFEGARLVAFCAYATVDKHGGRIGYVVELLHDPGRRDGGVALLSEALRRMADAGADVAFAWSFGHSPNARTYFNAGFVSLPERLRPIELHVGVRPLAGDFAVPLSDRRSWYISYCDSDTV